MKRNHGIDLLRMVLMLMVVMLHVLGKGGVLGATSQLSTKYGVSWLMETFAYCAVNCYALMSGYVYIHSKYRLSSLVQIYLQALLYCVAIAACVWVLHPERFSWDSLAYFLSPVSTGQYWYLSGYVGLFILIPFLNAAISSISQKQAKLCLGLAFFVFTVVPTLACYDAFSLGAGYGTFWLILMYLVGACIKKYGWWENAKPYKALFVYIICVLFSWGFKIGYESITAKLQVTPEKWYSFISYTSPTMVIAAVALFLAFKNARISPKLTKLISEFSPAAFGVYLIHEHEFIVARFISGKFAFLAQHSAPVMAMGVFASALAIFAVCLLIDWMRHKVFQWIHIKQFLEKLEEKYIHHSATTIQ